MARIDKVTQNFRAKAGTTLTGLLGVVVDAGGSVFPSGTADAQGVICLPGTIAAGEVVSALRSGEIVEFDGAAGTEYFAGDLGVIDTTSGGKSVGFTVEADRLVVDL